MRESKYKAKKTEVNGITFDSVLESKRYEQLLLLERAGEISNLTLQPEFQVWIGRKDSKTGEKMRSRYYVGDFMYIDIKEHKVIVEDTKGVETPKFRRDWDLVRSIYPEYEFRKVKKEDI